MTERYTRWAVILAACLELGIFVLAHLDIIGTATTLSCGFAVGAVLVTALMLRPAAGSGDEEMAESKSVRRRIF